MKKLITIMLFITLLSSCVISSEDNLIVYSKKILPSGRCIYKVDNFGYDVDIYYPCDMWDIGDTIKLTK